MITQTPEPRTLQWTREEYYRLAAEGHFEGKRVQLIDGEIIEMPAQGHSHVKAVSIARKWADDLFGADHWVRVQMPLNVGRQSDPEPDVAVAREPMEHYQDHPTSALLVIEVADTTLRLDRRKAALYAAANVDEYWIVNLLDRQMEVHRAPRPDERRYEHVTVHKPDETIAALARPAVPLAMAQLFR